ncbi:MAG: PAS domain-containing methyl-accepting chemotaxis protein [Rhodobacteraceae bacterium]|nr:PAS domain-containing methyl-accepting chemotaxis protein [Paracoccaceae bacterium]
MTGDALTIFNSVFSSGNAFIYRCANDDVFTMEFMAGQVEKLCGYSIDDILGNNRVAFGDLMHKEDAKGVFAEVDVAIEQHRNWDVDYRFCRSDGTEAWVRERGNAVYDDQGALVYLEGLVVDASAEVKLRETLESTLQTTEEVNAEIVELAENIVRSVRQLSILSINVGIEAARAGDAGLGFAYLAREIKNLSVENAEWARCITTVMAERKRGNIGLADS